MSKANPDEDLTPWIVSMPTQGDKDSYFDVWVKARNNEHALQLCGYSKHGVMDVHFGCGTGIEDFDDTNDQSDNAIGVPPTRAKPVFVHAPDPQYKKMSDLPDDYNSRQGRKITSLSQLDTPRQETQSVPTVASKPMPQETKNLMTSAKEMFGSDIKDAGLRASGRQATKFVKGLLLDRVVPKIDSMIVRAGAESFLNSTWGETAIKLVGGYGYAMVESRISMKPEYRALGNIISEHLRRDAISNVMETAIETVAVPIKDFIKDELASMSKEDIDALLEKERVRVLSDSGVVTGEELESATEVKVEKAVAKKRGQTA